MRNAIALSLIAVLFAQNTTRAGIGPPWHKPITESIDHAEVVVVASISQYTPDTPLPTSRPAGDDPYWIVLLTTFRNAGSYHFKRIHILKGQCEDDFEIHLPAIADYAFDSARFDLPVGTNALLLLKKDKKNSWMPVDPVMPVIPVSATALASASRDDAGHPKNPDAIDLMLASLPDKTVRPFLADILQKIEDHRVFLALRKYEDDENPIVQSAALYCMALNQDVSVIPNIARFAQEHHDSGEVIGGLALYTTADAIPFLNPLIVDGTNYTRINAMASLRNIADKTSIPFLIKALDVEDRQQVVSYGAYWTLHRLLEPTLGPPQNMFYFHDHHDIEIRQLKQWWEWEQIKAKKSAATQKP